MDSWLKLLQVSLLWSMQEGFWQQHQKLHPLHFSGAGKELFLLRGSTSSYSLQQL